MAQLVLQEHLKLVEDSDDEMMADPEEVNNYKGMYQNEEEEPEQRYFEFGAHFPYQLLYQKLKEIEKERARSEEKSNIKASVNSQFNSMQSGQGINKGIFIFIIEQNFRRLAQDGNKNILTQNTNQNTQNKNRNSNSNNRTGGNNLINNWEKVHFDSENTKNNKGVKPQSINLVNSASGALMENNYLLALSNNIGHLSNKSRNVAHIDNSFKHGTGMQIAATATTKNVATHFGAAQHQTNQANVVKEKEYQEKENLNSNRKDAHLKNHPQDKSNNSNLFSTNALNKKSNSITRNLGAGNNNVNTIKKEEKKTSGLNIYSSFTNDVINFNKSKETSLKKSDNLAPGQLFKKSNPVILVEKNKFNNNTSGVSGKNINTSNTGLSNPSNTSLKATRISTTTKSSVIKEVSEDKPDIKKKIINYSGVGHNFNNSNTTQKKNQINYSLSKIVGNAVSNVISTYNAKGRNQGVHINPHNTAQMNQTINQTAINTHSNKQKASGVNAKGIKKLNLDKLHTTANKGDAYRYITSSVDNREGANNHFNVSSNVNFDIGMRILNNKTNSLSPSKVRLEKENTSHHKDIQKTERDKDSSQMKIPLQECGGNNQGPGSTGLNDIISHISKNHETKSRNAPRNNLTSTKSNLFSSEKAQSMHSGSYQKTNLFTQVAVKTTTVIGNPVAAKKTSSNPKMKANPKLASNKIGKSMTIYKPGINVNKSLDKTKLKVSTSKANLVKKNTSVVSGNAATSKSIEIKKPITAGSNNPAKVITQKDSLIISQPKGKLINNCFLLIFTQALLIAVLIKLKLSTLLSKK